MKKLILQWLVENKIQFEFIESREHLIEDDSIILTETNVSIQLNQHEGYGIVVVANPSGTYTCYNPKYKFHELKQDTMVALSKDIKYLMSLN